MDAGDVQRGRVGQEQVVDLPAADDEGLVLGLNFGQQLIDRVHRDHAEVIRGIADGGVGVQEVVLAPGQVAREHDRASLGQACPSCRTSCAP